MDKNTQQKLIRLFRKHNAVKLVYFFGSHARGDEGPLSDYDFSVYLDLFDQKKLHRYISSSFQNYQTFSTRIIWMLSSSIPRQCRK